MSFIRKAIKSMDGYTPGEQPGQGKFIKLNTNENPYPPSPAVKAAVIEAIERLPRYPDSLATSFRLAAASVLNVDPEQILCGNGSDDLLTILTRAFVEPGAKLRLPYPSYVLYKTLALLQGAEPDEQPLTADWLPSAAFAASQDGVQLAFLPNPNSPTGTRAPREVVEATAKSIGCPLIVDEAYVDFAEEHCLPLVDSCSNVIVTRTLSKSYALAGLRFGYLVAPTELVVELRKVKDSYNCDTLSIAAATAAIMDQSWFEENRRRIVATRQRLTVALRELGFSVIDSEANFVWCEHSSAGAQPLFQQLKDRGVLVRYMKYSRWREGLRISIGTDEQIDALLSLLPQLV
ncbi:MAG: histidinol-phosphate transaminase [Planctomycetales bacterium]|nr:histidinol-phosphate transaminase [Planctomycetales bacterium]